MLKRWNSQPLSRESASIRLSQGAAHLRPKYSPPTEVYGEEHEDQPGLSFLAQSTAEATHVVLVRILVSIFFLRQESLDFVRRHATRGAHHADESVLFERRGGRH